MVALFMTLSNLRTVDYLQEGDFDGCPVYAHDEHRFVLPIVFEAQQRGRLPQPCKLIMFDAHHDALFPRSQDARNHIAVLRESGFTGQQLLDLCVRDLSKTDDDWVTAGMLLGLLSDVAIFGVRDKLEEAWINDASLSLISYDLAELRDPDGTVHRIHMRGFPGEELEYQGALSDHARARELAPFWRMLDWDYHKPDGFADSGEPILLDIDLDAFVMKWEDFTFPWPDEVFCARFLKPSNYFTTQGWTGQRFFRALVKRAGMIAIAREPKLCGGPEKTQQVWRQVNRFLFDDRLIVS